MDNSFRQHIQRNNHHYILFPFASLYPCFFLPFLYHALRGLRKPLFRLLCGFILIGSFNPLFWAGSVCFRLFGDIGFYLYTKPPIVYPNPMGLYTHKIGSDTSLFDMIVILRGSPYGWLACLSYCPVEHLP